MTAFDLEAVIEQKLMGFVNLSVKEGLRKIKPESEKL